MISTSTLYSFSNFLLINLLLCMSLRASAQISAQPQVTLQVKNTRLFSVLQEIEKQSGLYFSYDGRLINRDSLVTLNLANQPLNTALQTLFGSRFEYQQQGHYLVITPAMPRLALSNTDITTDGGSVSVSGLVTDERSGERLMNASVYEKDQLAATLTDEHGYFKLKLRPGSSGSIAVTAGKRLYHDTTVHFLQSVMVNARAGMAAYLADKSRGNRVERIGLGAAFISSRQMIQSLNIPNFFASRPFQVSITPGLSTHGMFSPQVVNKVSLNLIGGYTAGVDGIEAGGLFNINKRDSKYLQLAGIFNLVGGNMTGLQIAGAHNFVLDTLKGVQLALFANRAEGSVSGLQLSAFNNDTRYLKGVQIGLINRVDTSKGVSIGLLNIIRNGFYRVNYSVNNLANANVALKTGTHKFYSMLLLSTNISTTQKFYAFGLGIGHDFMLSDKFYISAEGNYHLANNTQFDNQWGQSKLLLNLQITPKISLVAGPTLNHYKYNHSFRVRGYRNVTNAPEVEERRDSYAYTSTRQWLGWEAGISFNSAFKPVKREKTYSQAWYLGFAATEGKGWDEPYKFVTGAELSLQRDLNSGITGLITAGLTHFSADSEVKPVNILPLKAGVRLKMNRRLFIQGDLGDAIGIHLSYHNGFAPYSGAYTYGHRSYNSLMYGFSVGFAFENRLETSFKFEDYGLSTQYKQFALRLGYRLKLSK
jgi:hypothetical protein